MTLAVYDRIQQTGTANTTVSFTLSATTTAYQSFAAVGNGNTTYYAATDGTNWEVGYGTYSTTGPTLTRTTILSSSNSNTAVTFSGTVTVWVDYPAGKAVYQDASNNVTLPAQLTVTNDATINGLTVGKGGGAVSNNTAVGYQSLNVNQLGANNTAGGYGALAKNTTGASTATISNAGSGYSTPGTYTGVQLTYVSGATATTYPIATIVVAGGIVTTVTITTAGTGFTTTGTVLTCSAASIGGGGTGFTATINVLTSGSFNTAYGYNSLTNNTVSSFNTALGYQALSGTNTVGYNTAVGYNSQTSVTSGTQNASLGMYALSNLTTGSNNTAVGYYALGLASNTGGNNTAVGNGALTSNTSGSSNAALGFTACGANTTASNNIGIGERPLNSNQTASGNIAIGQYALYNLNTTGTSNNIAIGNSAGYNTTATTTGTNLIYIGTNSRGSANNNTNEIVIGNSVSGLGSNTTVIGNSSTTLTKAFGVIVGTNYTVATLPSASTSGVGARAFVTDALTPVFGAAVTGGGAVPVPVYSTGSAWFVG